jgi:hypothetical protein
MISDAKKETRPPVDANTDGALNLVRAVMLVSREFVPRAIVPMHLHVIEYIAVFYTRENSIQVNAAPQGEVGELANAVEAPTMAKDFEQRGVARGNGCNFEGWVVRCSMSVRAKFVCFVA